jgi:Zn-dependent M28 family amino/carboxypeptidase
MPVTSPARLVCLASLLLLASACERAPVALPQPRAPDKAPTPAADAGARRIEADLRFLADDLLEGREAGTRGFALASLYVAERFRAIGLQPAGEDGSYYQAVPMLKATRQEEGARFVIERDGKRTGLRFREQFLPSLDFNATEFSLEAPAVFVGQAVHAPELQHDDFSGLDLRGKIAVLFPGAPARFDNDQRAYYSSMREKLRALVARGAIGAVVAYTAEDEARAPWARASAGWDKPGMRLRGGDGRGIDTFPELQGGATVSAAAADALFAGSGHTAAQLFEAAKDGTLKGFDLPGTLAIAGRTAIEPVESRNVVARLPGGDGALGREHVVYTAHLDHVGIGAPVAGDAIYNGALDNALGVAVMLEAARTLAAERQPPKRAALFVALTAEEKGLLGAEWFVRNPTVPRASLVANLNMDMPVLLAPSRDVVPIGVEHSSLQPLVEQAAKDVGVTLSPDPFPEEVVFVRSDQYAFIRAGIPAVYLDGGVLGIQPADAGTAAAGAPRPTAKTDPKLALRDFLRSCYHQPCDDASQPIRYADAARLARLNARIGVLVGNVAERPSWKPGDFFGERFGKAGAAPAP